MPTAATITTSHRPNSSDYSAAEDATIATTTTVAADRNVSSSSQRHNIHMRIITIQHHKFHNNQLRQGLLARLEMLVQPVLWVTLAPQVPLAIWVLQALPVTVAQ
jgi:hypothetical protein